MAKTGWGMPGEFLRYDVAAPSDGCCAEVEPGRVCMAPATFVKVSDFPGIITLHGGRQRPGAPMWTTGGGTQHKPLCDEHFEEDRRG